MIAVVDKTEAAKTPGISLRSLIKWEMKIPDDSSEGGVPDLV